jgi:hypothetical protein
LQEGLRADRDAERRGAGVSERAADGERLAGDDAGRVVSAQHRHRVHDPTHDLGSVLMSGAGMSRSGPMTGAMENA